MKTTIEVNGQEVEVDLENMSQQDQKQYNIYVNDDKKERKSVKKLLRINRHWNKFMRVLPILCLIAFFLCGFLIEGGWTWSWAFILVTPFAHMFISLIDKKLKTIISVLFSCMCLAAMLLIGFLVPGGWRWSWVLLLLIPVFEILVE